MIRQSASSSGIRKQPIFIASFPRYLLPLCAMQLFSGSFALALSQLDSSVEEVILQTTAEYKDIVMGQQAQDNRFILTPDSCFFYPKGPKLTGSTASSIPGSEFNSNQTFATIDEIDSIGQKVLWPIMPRQTGSVSVNVFLETANAGIELIVRLGDLEQTVVTTVSDGTSAQPWNLTATIQEAGISEAAIQDLEIELLDLNGNQEAGEIHKVELTGGALENAYLLRARWRPYAVHGSLRSSTLNASGLGHSLYIVEMRPDFSADDVFSFYAPVTTKFGYYGVTYAPSDSSDRGENDFFVPDAANFSMWSYNANQSQPPVPERSHLLAVGNGEQIFDGYGHEGSGVKPRNGNPLEGRTIDNLVLALRMESHVADDQYRYRTYIGYYWDEALSEWKFYAAGRDYLDDAELASEGDGFAAPNSFVEVPGGVTSQRTAQIKRILDYRGWIKDETGNWHAIDLLHASSLNTANIRSKDWSTTEDGWLRMKMGGIVHRQWLDNSVQRQITPVTTLPDYMDASKLAVLETIPVTVVMDRAVRTFDGYLKVEFTLEGLDAPAEVKLFHGDEDGMTLLYEKGAFPDEWDSVTSLGSFDDGSYSVKLPATDLPTEGFCRILVEANSKGRHWSRETGHWVPARLSDVDPNAETGDSAGSVRLHNPAGASNIYSIVSGNEDTLFALDSSTGSLTLAADFPETPASSYRLAVKAELNKFSSWRNTAEVVVVPGLQLLVEEDFDAGTADQTIAGSNGGIGWGGSWTGHSSWVYAPVETSSSNDGGAGLEARIGDQGTSLSRPFQTAVTIGSGTDDLSDVLLSMVMDINEPIAIGHSVRLEIMNGTTQIGYIGKKVNGSLGFELGDSGWQNLSNSIGPTNATVGTWHFALHLKSGNGGTVEATLYGAEADDTTAPENRLSYPYAVTATLSEAVTLDGFRLHRHNNTTSGIDSIRLMENYATLLVDSDGDNYPDITDPDDDNDGIPDADEIAHGFNPNSNADAALDSDSDGFNNLHEVSFGSDPNDAASVPGQLSISPNEQPAHTLSFPGTSGRAYSLWRSTTLETDSWTIIDRSERSLPENEAILFLDRSPPMDKAFYRVSVGLE